jgi:phosphohistidine swiveling domain-containing protein
MDDPWVLDWSEAYRAGPAVCGGKGWNLGRLARYGFRVPDGGVLVADAYARFLQAPAFQVHLDKIARLPTEALLDAVANGPLAALERALKEEPLPGEVEEALRDFLARTGLDQTPLAVRSSATAEDGPGASFAGIHRSSLGVEGPEAVLDAVRDCYASLWTPAALAYRRRFGLGDRDVACAVVLCRMVHAPGQCEPRAAGVAFTCDPVTGRRDVIALSAVPGLGEKLVGGRVNPEEVRVVIKGDRLELLDRSGGSPSPVLSDEQALEMARLALRVHWGLGDGQDPQDIEWAHDGGHFWVVQARPVTRPRRVTFPGAEGLPHVWSNANLKDVLPGVTSTFTWSMLQFYFWAILYTALDAPGYPVPAGMQVARRIHGRLYFDLAGVQWGFYQGLGLLPSQTNQSLGGMQPEIPVPPGKPFARLRRLWTDLKLVGHCLHVARTLSVAARRAREVAAEFRRQDLTTFSLAELLDELYRLGNLTLPLARQSQLGAAAAAIWQTLLSDLLEWRAAGKGREVAAGLMAGAGHVTAEIGYGLIDLAEIAREDREARELLARPAMGPDDWKGLPAGSPFRAAFERFLDEHGHRAVYETELANPRWREDPRYLLEQVGSMLRAEELPPGRQAARKARARAEAELGRCTLVFRPVARWLARRAREGSALRELGRSSTIRLWEPGRLVCLEIARRLHAAGFLEAPEDAFHLSWVEGECWLRGEWDGRGLRELVADRKARAEQWRREEPPDVIVLDAEGRPAELPAVASPNGKADSRGRSKGGRELWGVGASAGTARGVARVIRHPSEGHRLGPGEILVAPSTDPGWTPLFLRAAGLVMEVGGYLSHGAIVAREYGIPAVINVPGAVTSLRDGEVLTVDGGTGRIGREGDGCKAASSPKPQPPVSPARP